MNRQSIAMGTIRVARRLFARTPVHAWPITTRIARRVFGVVAPVGEDLTTDFRGLRMTVPAEDVALAPGIVGGYYEREELDLFERVAAASRTVIDVGGNIGIYACAGGRSLPTGGRLISFEPVPRNVEYLRRNLAQNEQRATVSVEPVAVGDADGEVTIHLAGSSSMGHSVSVKTAETPSGSVSDSVDVPVRAIDSYVAEHGIERVDVIKIDVEGFDLAVLRGARQTLGEHGPTLFVEYAPASLRNAGFDPVHLLDVVFDNYEHVLVIDEPRSKVQKADRAALVAFADKPYMLNLVGIRNPEHLALIGV
jgi:FkbM family methyltransferase